MHRHKVVVQQAVEAHLDWERGGLRATGLQLRMEMGGRMWGSSLACTHLVKADLVVCADNLGAPVGS